MHRLCKIVRHIARDYRLRRSIRRELIAAGIEGPTSMETVCERLSARRGKPIRLVAYPLRADSTFGVWFGGESAEYILYQMYTTPTHQQHIIAHELGHMLCGHASDETDDAVWEEVMPDVPPEMIRRALRRTHYDTENEEAAETAATMLLETAGGYGPFTAHSSRADRTQRALSDRQDWV